MTGSRNTHSVHMNADRKLESAVDFISDHHHIKKRSANDEGDTCKGLQGYQAKISNNTHSVVLALTTFQMPIFLLRFGQSKLYRSEDYGKTFEDITSLINNTFISTEFGIAIGPGNSGKVILTGDVSGSSGSRIFLSINSGESFTSSDLPFNPRMQIMYNPKSPNVLVSISVKNQLWISEDFAATWRKIYETVCVAKWGADNTLFFSTNLNGSCYERGTLVLMKTVDYGKTFKSIGEKVYSFGIGGRFLFASVMTGTGMMRMIHVSTDQGEEWNMAQLPPVGHEQFYSILAANDEMVFMHVDEPGDTGFGTIYVSDDRGMVYSKSLERHLYTATGDNSVQTVVTFDQGGEWVPLKKPENSQCDSTAKDKNKVFVNKREILIDLIESSVGDAISVLTPDVYVSDDGGYTWQRALEGPHHYAILDSGGLLVAVEHNPKEPISKLKFSTDEGQCWHEYSFTDEPIYFTGLASEPGVHSTNVSIWGYRDSMLSQYWVSVTIDFHELLTRDCAENDYVQWLAHSDDISDPNDGCMLGYKERFLRLKKDSVCWNGRDYAVTKQPTPCVCTLDDFLCDFGYYRKENSSECLEQAELKGHDLEYCIHGKKEHLQTIGYRKIPGDKCEGGVNPKRQEIDMSKKCVSDLLDPQLQTQETEKPKHSALIIVMVIAVLLISCVAGVVFIKKYVCGGRFLVHRYSVLQHNAEANGIEGVDEPLDTNVSRHSKITFHEDSDEVG
ncbi:Sortilin [Bagarius yarrelli]|uniref:Sortilin n=1 Tax=Bagarius yarrelli TaxID=175774 RepID=A0A556V6P0_BAGYA|nr:Sortilin [Bagarius yarrelli]